MDSNSINTGAPVTGAQENDEETLRQISPTRLAELKRTMKGAERRRIGLAAKIREIGAAIRRGYALCKDAEERVHQIQLNSEDVAGLRERRLRLVEQLEVAKRDHLIAKREYLAAVNANTIIARKRVKYFRVETQAVRQQENLLLKTLDILKRMIEVGGNRVAELLQKATDGDAKGFRLAFEKMFSNADPSHYENISRVPQVKTSIIKATREKLAVMVSENGYTTATTLKQKMNRGAK